MLKRTGETLFGGRLARFRAFSPLPALAVDFRYFVAPQKSDDVMDLENERTEKLYEVAADLAH